MPHVNKQMISFFLTTKCNLRCVYCYNSKERASLDEITLPLEIAKAGIDYYFFNGNSRHIRFYGPGEPTQAFSLMCSITEYAKEKAGSMLTAEIQTNGVFGHAVREWMLDNMNIVWVSFDGKPDVQNANRPLPGGRKSAPIIEDNIRWFVKNKSTRNLMVGARVTITNANINRQIDLVSYFSSLGISYIWTDPLFPTVDTMPLCYDEHKKQLYSFDMDAYVNGYLDARRFAESIGVFYGSFLMCNFDGVCNQHCRACTPVPHLTPDGYISACDMVTFGENPHHMDCFVYGRWNAKKKSFDFDEEKIAILRNRQTSNMAHCRNCRVRNYCGGYCLGEIVNETGKLDGQKPNTCKAICKLFDELGPTNTSYAFLHP